MMLELSSLIFRGDGAFKVSVNVLESAPVIVIRISNDPFNIFVCKNVVPDETALLLVSPSPVQLCFIRRHAYSVLYALYIGAGSCATLRVMAQHQCVQKY